MIGRQFSVLKTHILVHNYISSYCHCMLLADCLQNSPINDVRRFQAEIFTCMKYDALIPSSHWIISIHISITDHNSSPRGIGIPLPSTSLLRIRVTTNSQRDHSMLRYSRYKFNDWFSFCRPTALLPGEDTHEQSRQAGIHRAHRRSSIFVL